MAVLVWNNTGQRFYETGVDRGVFFSAAGDGYAWNGLISVSENSFGGSEVPVHLEGNRLYNIVENEDYQADIEAFSAPEEFLACDGIKSIATGLYVSQQPRATFGFSYRTIKGNDILKNSYAYKIHLVYNCTASPTARSTKTLSDRVEANVMKWSLNTVPQSPTTLTFKPTSHYVIDASKTVPAKLAAFENALYGNPTIGNSFLMSPDYILTYLT